MENYKTQIIYSKLSTPILKPYTSTRWTGESTTQR